MTNPRDAVFHLLARRGHRLTEPRRAVLEVLAERQAPLSVADIHDRLGPRRVNLVSVYRTVHLLLKLAVIRATDSPRGGQRYELAEEFTGHHHHLICQGCGLIEDLEGCLLRNDALVRLNRRVRHLRQFRVTEHELRLLGLCRNCSG